MTSMHLSQGEPPPSYTASVVPPPHAHRSRSQSASREGAAAAARLGATDAAAAAAASSSDAPADSHLESDFTDDDRSIEHPSEPTGRPNPVLARVSSDAPRAHSPTRPGPTSSTRDLPSSYTPPPTLSQRSLDRHVKRASAQRATAPDTERLPSRSSTITPSLRPAASLDSALEPDEEENTLLLQSDEPIGAAATGFTSGDADQGFDSGLPSIPSSSARAKRQEQHDTKRQEEDKEALLFLFLLYPLRLLAIVPEVLAAHTLLRKSITLALAQQDLRRVGLRREPGPLELFMAIFWVHF